MKFTLVDLFSFSILIAAIIGWVRFSKINSAYYPFIYCIWVALVNEILGYFLIYNGISNAINNNVYVLIEAVLITWQFQRWGIFQRIKPVAIILIFILIISWAIEAFLIKGIKYNISYFRIGYSFAIVLMSINMLSDLITKDRKSIVKNSTFLICTGFILYFTFKVLTGVFWLYGLGQNQEFRKSIVWILIYFNLIANLIYALAVLWMPTKQRFTLPS